MLCEAAVTSIRLDFSGAKQSPAMALRSRMWSSSSLARGLGLAHQASLTLEADPEYKAMKEELLEARLQAEDAVKFELEG